jgi:alkylation response protein AidB-like acyl-CoA dehydrogenase
VTERDERTRGGGAPADAWAADEPAATALLGPPEREVRRAVRAIVAREVAPRARHVDATEEFPHDGYQALARAGLAGLLFPAELGGSGHSTLAYAVAMEEIAAACGATAAVYMTQMHAAYPIYLAGTPAQQQRFVPPLCDGTLYGAIAISEPEGGSDVAAMRTVARRESDAYAIDGSKTFITTGDRAGVVVLFATLDRARGRDGITAFLIEPGMAGFAAGRPMHKLGIRGSSTAELFFSSCRVPASSRLGGEGEGFALSMRSVVKSRISAAAQGLGLARGAYEKAVRWAAARGLLGSADRDAQDVQFALADLRTRILAARLLLYRVAARVDEARDDLTGEIAMVKLHCTDLAMAVTAEAVDLLGEEGDLEELEVERYLRDAKVTQIYDGTNQIQRLLIARDTRRGLEASP